MDKLLRTAEKPRGGLVGKIALANSELVGMVTRLCHPEEGDSIDASCNVKGRGGPKMKLFDRWRDGRMNRR
jgi:hypothetical protein